MMDANVAEQLGRYSRGEASSRSVMDATGLNYRQVLDGLGELGLRLPRFSYETASEDLRRGYDNFLAYLLSHPEQGIAGE